MRLSDNVCAVAKIVSASKSSIGDAVQDAVETVSKAIRNLDRFEVKETRGFIDKSKVACCQAFPALGFRCEK